MIKMKCLIWYCKELYMGNVHPSERIKEELDKKELDINENNIIMPWVTIETENDYNYFEDFLETINEMKNHFNSNKIALTPFAHLANSQVSFKTAFRIICDLEEFLKQKGFTVIKGHFGSAKDLRFYSPADTKQVVFRSYPKPEFLK